MKEKIANIFTPLFARYVKPWSRHLIDIVLPPLPFFSEKGKNIGTQGLWSDVRFLDEPCCSLCGFPFDYDLGGDALCGQCITRRPAYDKARAAFVYDDISRRPILAFKHGGRTEALSMFGMQMSRAGRHLLPEADMLVPVPLHSARLIKRRFNQSALLAREVSRFHDLEVETESLIRIKKTPSQGGKSTLGRRRNVAGAFKLRRTDRVKGKTIILIDDVFTTGATLEACARTLRKGGAERIYAITLARVVKGQVIPK